MNGSLLNFLALLGIIAALLMAATAVGIVLKKTFSPNGPNHMIEGLNARISAWWGMLILMSLASVAGRTGVIVLFAFASFAALREFLTLTTKTRADHWALLAAFFVVLPFQYFLIWADWYGLYTVFIPVYAFLMLPMVAALRGEPGDFLIRVAETQWALMIAVFCISHIPALLTLNIPGFQGSNSFLIVFLVVVVQLSDVLQYAISRLTKGHPLAPALSRSRTIQGVAGGAIGAAVIGAALHWITPFSTLGAAGLALIIALVGFLGGLVMTAIKRDRGVHDWGQIDGGYGGFIDRLDSVIFAAPIFFHLVRYGWQ